MKHTILTKQIAEQFMTGNINTLNKFSLIDDDAAEVLAEFEGEVLSLKGLTQLSDAAATSLSKHQGELILSGLTELGDSTAKSLCNHQWKIDLSGLIIANDDSTKPVSLDAINCLGTSPQFIIFNDDFVNNYRTLFKATNPQLFSFSPGSKNFSTFSSLRANTIASKLPLEPLVEDERFLSRIRQDQGELNEYLTLINEEISDPLRKNLILSFFNSPEQQDWSINVCSKTFTQKLEEAYNNEKHDEICEIFYAVGALCVHHCFDNEETLYEGHATGNGQEWLAPFINGGAGKNDLLLERSFLFSDTIDTGEIATYLNNVGILTAGPNIGDKWLNYKVVAREICDFLNRIVFPECVVLFISRSTNFESDEEDESSEDVESPKDDESPEYTRGTFVLVSTGKLDEFVEKVGHYFPK